MKKVGNILKKKHIAYFLVGKCAHLTNDCSYNINSIRFLSNFNEWDDDVWTCIM
jgi:hypothetical protein